jgi:uncharacterized BrkB/YihY/UPF0761 family membrane protein
MINWQLIFYIISSLGMLAVLALAIIIFIFLYQILMVLQRLEQTLGQGGKLIKDIRYFRKGFKVGILRLILRFLENKGGHNDRN